MLARCSCFVLVTVAVGCSEPPAPSSTPDAAPAPTASASAPAPATSAPHDAGASASDAGTKVAMPERPVPKDVAVVRMDMPEEVQMKAITYMSAMRAPHADDPAADSVYAEELRKKLDGLSKALDRGGDKATMNKSAVMGGGRQIDLLMSEGCQPETPKKLLVQRAGVQLNAAYSRGVLVIRCNDKTLQCLQSTRDPDDVLCTSAPRKAHPGLPGKPPGK